MLRGQPMKLTTQRIFSFSVFFLVVISPSKPLSGSRFGSLAALFVDLGGVPQMQERVEGRLDYIVRVRSADGLGQHVLNSRYFHYRAHRASRNDAGAIGRGLQQDLAGTIAAENLMRDGRAFQIELDHVFL